MNSSSSRSTQPMLLIAAFLCLMAQCCCSAFVSSIQSQRITGTTSRSQSFLPSGSSELSMSSALMDSARPSFEDRMRSMVLGGGRKKKQAVLTSDNKETTMPSNIKVVKTLGEYKDVVGGERDRIVVVRFFAPWCKACKANQPLFYRLAFEFTDVLFVEVPVTETNANLHQGLGIPSLPFGHIYSPNGGLVEELKITRPNFAKFTHKLQTYIHGKCELVDGEVSSPYVPKEEESIATPH